MAELAGMTHQALKDLPKVELHCHLELAFRKKTLQRWAVEAGMAMEKDPDFAQGFLITEPMAD